MHRCLLALILLLVPAATARALTPFVDQMYSFSKSSNIVYGNGPINKGGGSMNLLLDLYKPVSLGIPVPSNAPAIVLIHGGGFVGGDKTDMDPLAQLYASYGYTVASINYRMYNDLPPSSSPGPADTFTPPPAGYDTFPDLQLGGNAINAAVIDAELAMTWMHNHGATNNFNPNRIAIGGVSAGAITSLLQAYHNPPGHIAPNAVLDFLGSMYGTQDAIQPGAPPAFIFHGTVDTQVPFSGDQAVADRLAATGVYHEFYVGQGIGHDLSQAIFAQTYGTESLQQHNAEFLYNHLVVPEPATVVPAALGGLALALAVWRRNRAAATPQGKSQR